MDFNDSQQEAAFRKEARDFLDANAEKRSIISDKPNDKNPQIAFAGAPETVKGGKEAAQEACIYAAARGSFNYHPNMPTKFLLKGKFRGWAPKCAQSSVYRKHV